MYKVSLSKNRPYFDSLITANSSVVTNLISSSLPLSKTHENLCYSLLSNLLVANVK